MAALQVTTRHLCLYKSLNAVIGLHAYRQSAVLTHNLQLSSGCTLVVPRNLKTYHDTSRDPATYHEISQSISRLLQISRDFARFHEVLRGFARIYEVSQDTTSRRRFYEFPANVLLREAGSWGESHVSHHGDENKH